MPAIKGKPRQPQPLRCYVCGSRKLEVERGQNSRVIHKKRRVVANVVCTECKNEWWSYHPMALRAAKAADAAESGRAPVPMSEGTAATDGGAEAPPAPPAPAPPTARPGDVDSTEPRR